MTVMNSSDVRSREKSFDLFKNMISESFKSSMEDALHGDRSDRGTTSDRDDPAFASKECPTKGDYGPTLPSSSVKDTIGTLTITGPASNSGEQQLNTNDQQKPLNTTIKSEPPMSSENFVFPSMKQNYFSDGSHRVGGTLIAHDPFSESKQFSESKPHNHTMRQEFNTMRHELENHTMQLELNNQTMRQQLDSTTMRQEFDSTWGRTVGDWQSTGGNAHTLTPGRGLTPAHYDKHGLQGLTPDMKRMGLDEGTLLQQKIDNSERELQSLRQEWESFFRLQISTKDAMISELQSKLSRSTGECSTAAPSNSGSAIDDVYVKNRITDAEQENRRLRDENESLKLQLDEVRRAMRRDALQRIANNASIVASNASNVYESPANTNENETVEEFDGVAKDHPSAGGKQNETDFDVVKTDQKNHDQMKTSFGADFPSKMSSMTVKDAIAKSSLACNLEAKLASIEKQIESMEATKTVREMKIGNPFSPNPNYDSVQASCGKPNGTYNCVSSANYFVTQPVSHSVQGTSNSMQESMQGNLISLPPTLIPGSTTSNGNSNSVTLLGNSTGNSTSKPSNNPFEEGGFHASAVPVEINQPLASASLFAPDGSFRRRSLVEERRSLVEEAKERVRGKYTPGVTPKQNSALSASVPPKLPPSKLSSSSMVSSNNMASSMRSVDINPKIQTFGELKYVYDETEMKNQLDTLNRIAKQGGNVNVDKNGKIDWGNFFTRHDGNLSFGDNRNTSNVENQPPIPTDEGDTLPHDITGISKIDSIKSQPECGARLTVPGLIGMHNNKTFSCNGGFTSGNFATGNGGGNVGPTLRGDEESIGVVRSGSEVFPRDLLPSRIGTSVLQNPNSTSTLIFDDGLPASMRSKTGTSNNVMSNAGLSNNINTTSNMGNPGDVLSSSLTNSAKKQQVDKTSDFKSSDRFCTTDFLKDYKPISFNASSDSVNDKVDSTSAGARQVPASISEPTNEPLQESSPQQLSATSKSSTKSSSTLSEFLEDLKVGNFKNCTRDRLKFGKENWNFQSDSRPLFEEGHSRPPSRRGRSPTTANRHNPVLKNLDSQKNRNSDISNGTVQSTGTSGLTDGTHGAITRENTLWNSQELARLGISSSEPSVQNHLGVNDSNARRDSINNDVINNDVMNNDVIINDLTIDPFTYRIDGDDGYSKGIFSNKLQEIQSRRKGA